MVLPVAAIASFPPVCASRSFVLMMYRSGPREIVCIAASTWSLIGARPASTSSTPSSPACTVMLPPAPTSMDTFPRTRRMWTSPSSAVGIAGVQAQLGVGAALVCAPRVSTRSADASHPRQTTAATPATTGRGALRDLAGGRFMAPAPSVLPTPMRRPGGAGSASSRCTRDTSSRRPRAAPRTVSRTDL